MRDKASRRLRLYLPLAFIPTWAVHIALGIAFGAFETGEPTSVVFMGVVALTMFIPTVATLVTLKATGELGSFDLGLKPRIRKHVPAYLASWLCPALLSLAGTALYFLVWPDLFDPSHSNLQALAASAGADAVEDSTIVLTVLLALIGAPFMNVLPSLGEELGWRTLLFPTLAEITSRRRAVLVSGLIWGMWHAPLICMGHNYGIDTPLFPISNLAVMCLSCVSIGILLAELRLRTKSVWPCALAHGAINATASMGLLFSSGGPTIFGPSVLGLVATIPTLCLSVFVLLSDRSALNRPQSAK